MLTYSCMIKANCMRKFFILMRHLYLRRFILKQVPDYSMQNGGHALQIYRLGDMAHRSFNLIFARPNVPYGIGGQPAESLKEY